MVKSQLTKLIKMKVVKLQKMWDYFNQAHFKGELTPIPIKPTKSKRYHGQFFEDPYPAIHLSGRLNQTEADFSDSLLHEMIHQYLFQKKIEDESDHGPKFIEIAARLGVRLDNEFIK